MALISHVSCGYLLFVVCFFFFFLRCFSIHETSNGQYEPRLQGQQAYTMGCPQHTPPKARRNAFWKPPKKTKRRACLGGVAQEQWTLRYLFLQRPLALDREQSASQESIGADKDKDVGFLFDVSQHKPIVDGYVWSCLCRVPRP